MTETLKQFNSHLMQPGEPDDYKICKLEITEWNKSTQLNYFSRISTRFFFPHSIYTFFVLCSRAHSSRTSIKKLFDFNECSSNSLFITDYEGGNVSDHCWEKSAGIKRRMNYDMKIILSFSRLFHMFISTLLVSKKEREYYTMRVSGSIKQLFPSEMYFSLSH